MINQEVKEKIGNISDYIIERGHNSYGYWTKYKSGYIEQWGSFNLGANSVQTFNLPISFVQTDFYCDTIGTSSSSSSEGGWSHVSRTNNTVTGRFAKAGLHYFYACGY